MALMPKQYGFKEGLTSQEYYDQLTALGDWENYNKTPDNLTPQEQLDMMLAQLKVQLQPPTHDEVKLMIERAGYTLLMEIGAYWGHLLHNCKVTVTEGIPTACVYVDKVEAVIGMAINPKFFAMLTDTDRVGILYHELQHIALAHLMHGKVGKQWNYAQDLAINSKLVKVRPKLMTLPKEIGGGHGGKGGNNAEGEGDPNSGDLSDANGADREVLIRALKRAAEQTQAGNIPAHVTEAIDALEKMRPKRWHQELRMFYRSTVEGIERARTWARPNRRYGLWEAGTKSGEGKRLLIGIDTSGSMSTEDIQHILKECQSMLKCGVEAKVMFFDTKVHATVKLTKDIKVTECGRGGTDFKDFFTKAQKYNPDGIVVFTDGDDGANLGKSVVKGQVMWVLVAGDRQHGTCANFGKKVILDR